MLPLTTEVSLTEKAISRLKDIKAYGDKFLRVSVVPGGCSGMTFNAIVDDAQTGFDIVVYDLDGIKVITDRESNPYLGGLEIDYSDDLIQAGFRFKNKKALKSCACGSSFEV
jgi:iron-sulfur cluster assembly accessory protein